MKRAVVPGETSQSALATRRAVHGQGGAAHGQGGAARLSKGGKSHGGLRCERGLSTVEYIILLVIIAAVAVAVWSHFGLRIKCYLLAADSNIDRHLQAGETPPSHSLEQQCADLKGGVSSGGLGGEETSAANPTAAPGASAGNPGGSAVSADERWINDVIAVYCPKDSATLDALRARGVTVTAYDRIYYEDPYYDGTQWTTKHFEGGGQTDKDTMQIHMIRSGDAQGDAATLYHEGVHTGQPDMAWREKEYDAYEKEEAWAIERGFPPHDPSFRTVDSNGRTVPNRAGIHSFVDNNYPGVSVTAPAGGPPEEVKDKMPNGDVVVERADGSKYTRRPKAGDSFAGEEITEPPGGVTIPASKLRCP